MTSAEARTVAFMDIGTNSIRLLLVRLYPNHSHTILTELKQIVRLGEGEFVSQHLQPAAMERAVLVAKPIIRPPLCSASRQRSNSTYGSSPGWRRHD